MTTGADEGPPPTDVEGWRSLIQGNRLASIKSESLVAAIQEIGPDGDDSVRGRLMQHVLDRITRILLRMVSRTKPNRDQIIDRLQAKLAQAILKPASKDGQGLREAFVARVEHRAMDAIRNVDKIRIREPSYDQNDDLPSEPSPGIVTWTSEQQEFYVTELLEKATPDLKKRLAFRLHMDGAPYSSTRGTSIAGALGIDDTKARRWVAEVIKEIKKIRETNND
jgi:hypothetical protein